MLADVDAAVDTVDMMVDDVDGVDGDVTAGHAELGQTLRILSGWCHIRLISKVHSINRAVTLRTKYVANSLVLSSSQSQL